MSRPLLFLLKALGPGERWITVHPNGRDMPGHPVLIKESGDGAAHVIGGAGGKLNGLKLRGVKSADQYKAEAAASAKVRGEERKRRAAEDRKNGLADSKAKAKEVLRASLGDHRAKFVEAVAAATGMDTAFPEHLYMNVSSAAREKAEQRHAAQLLKKANEVAGEARKTLLEDGEARARAGLGEVPLTSSRPEDLTVEDLDPAQASGKGLGFSANYGKRAKAAGLTDEALAQEAGEVRARAKGDGQGAAPREPRKVDANAIATELAAIRDPGPTLDPAKEADDRQRLAILQAQKELRNAQKQAREHFKKIEQSKVPVEPQAYVIETGNKGVDKDVTAELEQDLRTIRGRAFLDEVGKLAGGADSLGAHIGIGAFNSANAVALAVGGSSLIDRSVVDVLGPAGAAQVLANRLTQNLTPDELADVQEAMERYHADAWTKLTGPQLQEARRFHELANDIQVGDARDGHELAQAQELNAKRREYAGNAQRILGQALGEMEMNAALVVALKAPRKKLDVSMGKMGAEAAIQRVRALGLQRGEYSLERAGASTMLTLSQQGMDRLAAPMARDDLQRVRDAMNIIDGHQDEEDWLPKGVADRPDIGLEVKPGVAPRIAKPFPENPRNVRQAVRDYVGGRAADGDAAGDIVADLFAEMNVAKSGNREAYLDAANELAPMKDGDGNMIRAEAHQEAFDALADEYARNTFGSDKVALNRQRFEPDKRAADALHRALTQHPEGVAAFKPIGELTAQDQRALRDVFAAEYGEGKEAGALRDELAKHRAAEPSKYTEGTPEDFPAWEAKANELNAKVRDAEEADRTAALADGKGLNAEASDETKALQAERKKHMAADPTMGGFMGGRNPAWGDWRSKHDELAGRASAATMSWGKYLAVMGRPADAYAALQDVVRSSVLRSFAEHMNKLDPRKPLKIGRASIRNDLNHLAATDPEEAERRIAERRALIDGLRTRNADGTYGQGGVKGKLDAAQEQQAALDQSQVDMFGFAAPPPAPAAEEGQAAPEPEEAKLEKGRRWSIGHEAERTVASMMPEVGRNFRPGDKLTLWKPTMSGKFVGRQRAVKLIKQNKKTVLGLGVGSGKTSIALSAFTDLHAEGKAHRGLFIVPSIVQGQFHGEALTLLEPGKYKWHAQPGSSQAERIAAMKDDSTHFVVTTHQSFRDDMLHLAAQREGSTPDQVADKLDKMSVLERKAYMGDLLEAEGINADYLAVDEGHQLLNRKGKENSRMSNVIDGVGHSRAYHVSMSGDPVKNDISEAFDILSKMDPQRYQDRDAFIRKYGVDTAAARDGLRREMARHFYTGRIESGVGVTKTDVSVQLSQEQQDKLGELDKAAAKAKLARRRGDVDVDALRTLSPTSFEGVPEAQHIDVARNLNPHVGILLRTAEHHAVNSGAKTDKLVELADQRRSKPGVVFAHSLDRVQEIAQRLEKDGHKVVVLTGADSSKEKDKKAKLYRNGGADILVASDAGAVGANMQRGQWLAQYDTPMTAMVHAQRRGRIDRIGQKNNVELLDLIADHKVERDARQRLANKYELRDVMTAPLDGLDDTGFAGILNRIRSDQGEEQAPLYEPMPDEPEPVPDEQGGLF